MPKGTLTLPTMNQGQIPAFHSSRMTVAQTAKKLERSRCAIYTYFKAPKRYGKANTSDRPRKIWAQMQRRFINKLKGSSKIGRKVKKQLDVKVSRLTIERIINKASHFVC